MLLKPKRSLLEFGSNPENPFEGDELNRMPAIMRLTTRITKEIPTPGVMALNADWGAGKTAFIKMWAAHLNKEGVPALYLNAWSADFAEDPLLPFNEQMQKQMSQTMGEDTKKTLKHAEEASQAIVPLLATGGVYVAADAVTSGVSVLGRIAAVAANMFLKFGWKRIGNSIKKKLSFRVLLEKLMESTDAGRIVVFVDELDRCRPDFVVRLMERIEHMFKIPGLVFVFGVNWEYLCHSIKGLYGSELIAGKYLERFFDFDYSLEKPVGDYWKVLLGESGIAAYYGERGRHDIYPSLLRSFLLMDKIYEISLRGAEHIMYRINMTLSATEARGVFPEFLAFLVAVREADRRKFDYYLDSDTSMDDAIKAWEEQIKGVNIYGDSEMLKAATTITACLIVSKHNMGNTIGHKKNYYANQVEIKNTKERKEYAAAVADALEKVARTENVGMLSFIVNRIELLNEVNLDSEEGKEYGGSNG